MRCDAATPIPFEVSGINTHTHEPLLKPSNHDTQVAALAEHLIKAEETSGGKNTMCQQFGMQLTATEPSGGTVSKELAMLEVLSQQVAEPARVEQLHGGSACRTIGHARIPGEDEKALPRLSADEMIAQINMIAAKYAVEYEVSVSTGGSFLVNVSDAMTMENFRRSRVKLEESFNTSDNPRVKVNMRLRDQTEPDGWENKV